MRLLILSLHSRIRRGHPVLPYFFRGQLPPRHLQATQVAAKLLDIAARVQQRAERHVAANARKAIKIRQFHGSTPQPWQPRGAAAKPARNVSDGSNFDTIGGAM